MKKLIYVLIVTMLSIVLLPSCDSTKKTVCYKTTTDFGGYK